MPAKPFKACEVQGALMKPDMPHSITENAGAIVFRTQRRVVELFGMCAWSDDTFGQRLWAAGVGFKDRQDLLGHAVQRMITHYSAAEFSHLIEAANKDCVRLRALRFCVTNCA